MVDACECAANWRVELTNLLTGATLQVVTPVMFEFETGFMEPGRGSITFMNTFPMPRERIGFLPVQDYFPGATGIFFSRIAGGAATPNNPVHMFGGFIETVEGNSDGTVTVGFAEMQKYLDFRQVRTDLVFTGISQTFIGRDLVMYARGENINGGSTDDAPAQGIPLIGGLGASAFNRDRTYLAVDRPKIGELIRNLTQVENGPVYQLFHYRNAGPIPGLTENWFSEMAFFDALPQPDPAPTISWNHLVDFKVGLDLNEIANQVDAFGDPDSDGNPLIYAANSPYPFLPRFDAAPSFSGVTNLTTLNQNAFGYQQDHADPALNLQLHFAGVEYGMGLGGPTLTLDDLVPGIQVNIDIQMRNWVIQGGPQMPEAGTQIPSIGRVSVSAGQEGPEQVTAQIIVDSYPLGFLNGFPEECTDC